MNRKRKKAECKETPAWLVSFGDLMSLLLTFFILLFSMSAISLDKFNESIRGITEAFGGRKMVHEERVLKGRKVALDFPEMHPKIKNGEKIKNRLNEARKMLDKIGAKSEIEAHGTYIRLRLFTDRIFLPGGATPHHEAVPYIMAICDKLKDSGLSILIEGHTDNLPIMTDRFKSNWELSAARATNVLRLFIKGGYDPNTLSAKGCGEYNPLSSNETSEGRTRNRRIEFVIKLSV